MVLAFTAAWAGGDLVFDGPGHALWVRLAQDHRWLEGTPWWLGEMWSGTPVWGLAPSFPILNLVPFAALFGPDHAVKLAAIASQVAAGWGAMVLARSLWGRTPAAIVAGIMYALHPIVVVHLGLWGEQQVLGVVAATPWLVWSLLAALRGRGRRWVALAGLLSGFALLQQAEYVYGPLLVCALIVMTEASTALHDGGFGQLRALLGRAAGVAGIAAGLAAYWLLPLAKLSNSFVLTPPSWVRLWLTGDTGRRIGNPELFLSRPTSVHGPVTFNTVDAFNTGIFYLSWVCALLALVTIVVLARRAERTLSAVLLGTWLALWTSVGGIALSSRSYRGGTLVFVVVVGVVSGLLAGAFLRNLGLGRFGTPVAVVVVLGLFAAPYIAPFLAAQDVVPLLRTARFPRLFAVAPLGLALASAYPLTLLPGLLARRSEIADKGGRLRPGRVVMGASIVVVLAFLIDILPVRSVYFLHPPDTSQADARMAASLTATGDDYRVSSPIDPRVVDAVLRTRRELSSGWPHPLASPGVFHLSYETALTPPGFRDAALALSATGYIVLDSNGDEVKGTGRPDLEPLNSITVVRNSKVLPIVRAYDQAVVVHDADVAPDLAVTLSQRNIGVVGGDKGVADRMQGLTRAVVAADNSCQAPRAERFDQGGVQPDGAITDALASVCSIHNWAGSVADLGWENSTAAGGVVRPTVEGLSGISVWLDRPAGDTVLTLRELEADGRTLGPVVSSSVSTTYDENAMSLFPVASGATAKGDSYVFLLACPSCHPGEEPRMVRAEPRDDGNLVRAEEIESNLAAGFDLHFGALDSAPPSSTKLAVTRHGSGTWRVESRGERASLVVLAASWFPGWEAHVDGKAAPVLEADGAFVGVSVPGGAHQITFAYRQPAEVVVGRLISVATLVLAVALLIPWRRRERRPRGARQSG